MAEASSSSSIIVSWKPPEIHEWNGIITEYLATVEVSSDGTKSEHVFTALNCWLNYTIEGIPHNSLANCCIANYLSHNRS